MTVALVLVLVLVLSTVSVCLPKDIAVHIEKQQRDAGRLWT